jgi:signal transduction histidine kinase
VALTLFLVTVFVLNRLDDQFRQQQQADLVARTDLIARFVDALASEKAGVAPVVNTEGVLNPAVGAALRSDVYQRFMADRLAEADVDIVIGLRPTETGDVAGIVPAANGSFHAAVESPSRPGLTQESLVAEPLRRVATFSPFPYVIEVRLSNPYTFRQVTIDNVTTIAAAVGAVALGIAVLVAAAMAIRVTTPLRRLTEASRALAEGELGRRIPGADVRAGSSELAALAVQFNAMADQLEESVEIIRRDRDRGRDFLADVSHELRTPIAALLTFNELLTERPGDDRVHGGPRGRPDHERRADRGREGGGFFTERAPEPEPRVLRLGSQSPRAPVVAGRRRQVPGPLPHEIETSPDDRSDATRR